MPALRHIQTDCLEVGYFETGPAMGMPVILLHGFPYDAHSYTDVMGILAARGFRCIAPFLRGYGPTRFRADVTPRSGEQAALGADLLALMNALSIERAILAGYDWGGRAACVAAALWPERVIGLVSCGAGYNIQDIANAHQPSSAVEEVRYWYMYLFQMKKGRASLTANPKGFCKHIWSTWSPTWGFDDATFDQSAASFQNPDFVDVVIHSYRHRFGNADGDPAYAAIEARLAKQPEITVPTVVLQGADDTVDPPLAKDRLSVHFTSGYTRHVLKNTGHNPPQENPVAFSKAVISLTG